MTDHIHHFLVYGMELAVIGVIAITSFGFTSFTGLSADLYKSNSAEVAEALLDAMQNPSASLKQGNIISIRDMDLDVENTFSKWYCTYGAARISPEFFPFIDEKTQQRTRWGNAVDRCKNASETWYKIWITPAQWALVVYDAGWKFWIYGHVGKVLHYDSSMKKIIVRDMARIAKGKMSDRREDLTTAQVKCYIYNKTNTTTPTTPTIPSTTTKPSTPTTPFTPVTPVTPTTPSTPVTPVTPVTPTTPTTQPEVTPQETIDKELTLKLEDLSDIAEHFLTQNDLHIKIISKSPLKLGEVAKVILEITDKNWEKYVWLLPFAFTILSTNDTLQPSISNIKLVNDGKVEISVLAQKAGKAAIVITMDGTKIGEFNIEVK